MSDQDENREQYKLGALDPRTDEEKRRDEIAERQRAEDEDHEAEDDGPRWLSLKGLNYKGGGVMHRRTP